MIGKIRENSAGLVIEKEVTAKIRPVVTESLKEKTFDPRWVHSTRKLEEGIALDKRSTLENRQTRTGQGFYPNKTNRIDILA